MLLEVGVGRCGIVVYVLYKSPVHYMTYACQCLSVL